MSCLPKSREFQSKCGLKTRRSIHQTETVAQLVNFLIKKLTFSATLTDDGHAVHSQGREGQGITRSPQETPCVGRGYGLRAQRDGDVRCHAWMLVMLSPPSSLHLQLSINPLFPRPLLRACHQPHGPGWPAPRTGLEGCERREAVEGGTVTSVWIL